MKSRFCLTTQVSIAQPLQQSSTDCLYPCDECTLKGYAHPFAFVYPSDLNLEDLSGRRASSSSQFREVTWRLTLAHTRCSAFMVLRCRSLGSLGSLGKVFELRRGLPKCPQELQEAKQLKRLRQSIWINIVFLSNLRQSWSNIFSRQKRICCHIHHSDHSMQWWEHVICRLDISVVP